MMRLLQHGQLRGSRTLLYYGYEPLKFQFDTMSYLGEADHVRDATMKPANRNHISLILNFGRGTCPGVACRSGTGPYESQEKGVVLGDEGQMQAGSIK